jgi:hypothetical protein
MALREAEPFAGYRADLDACYRAERQLCGDLASVVAFQRSLIPTLGPSFVKLHSPFPSAPDLPPADPAEFSAALPPAHRHGATNRDLYFAFAQLIHQKVARTHSTEITELFRRTQKALNDRFLYRRLQIWERLAPALPPGASAERDIPDSLFRSTLSPEVKDVTTALLRQAQRIITKDRDARLPQFSPDVESLRQIEDKLTGEVTLEKLSALLRDATKTHEELVLYHADLEQQCHAAEVAQRFPDPAVVRDNPRFREVSAELERKLMEVRTALFAFQSDYAGVLTQFKEMLRLFEKGFAIPRLHKELEKLQDLSRQDQDQSLKHRELLVVRQVLEHTKIKNPHPWSAREFVDSELCDFEKAVEFARNGQFDAALEILSGEFEKYSDMERLLKEERDAVLAARARAEKERTNWYGKKSKPHDRQLQVQLGELKAETERQFREFDELKSSCERKMEDSLGRVAEALQKLQKLTMIPRTFESDVSASLLKKARRDWLLAQIEEARERRDGFQKKRDRTLAQTQAALEEIEELKRQYQILGEKSQTSQPADEEIDERHGELRDAYYCQQCIRLGYERPRDTVLAKCGHSYCAECVDQLVKNRNRKCPVCYEPFDPNAANVANRVIEIKWPK